jgi:hypothetical protein
MPTEPTFDVHCGPACDEHAHCSACGEVMRYEAGRLVCDDCLTDALTEPKSWEPAQ